MGSLRITGFGSFLAITVICVDACGGGGPRFDAGQFAQATRIDSTTYVMAARLRATEVRRVCRDRRPPECPLRPIVVGALASHQRIIFADSDGLLRVFDSTGAYDYGIGGLGTGPADYEAPTQLRVLEGQGVLVYDAALREAVQFDSIGRAGHRLGLTPSADFESARLWSKGVAALDLPPARRVGAAVAGTILVAGIEGLSRATRSFEVPLRALRIVTRDLEPMRPFFEAQPVWAIDPADRVLVTSGSSTWIGVYSIQGSPLLAIRIPITREPVTPQQLQAEKSRVLKRFSPSWRARTIPIIDSTARLSPKIHPLITQILAFPNDRVWVRESPVPSGDSVRWDVLKENGVLVGYLLVGTKDRMLDGRAGAVLIAHNGARQGPYLSIDSLEPD